jgi:hypothetical protein
MVFGFYTASNSAASNTWTAGITEDADTAGPVNNKLSVGHMTSATAGNVSVNANSTHTTRWGVVTYR